MKILSLTAGAAGMYCGSCLRDNALAAELVSDPSMVTARESILPCLEKQTARTMVSACHFPPG